MADVIFFVHGVGEHPKDWEKGVVEQLRKFCDEYSRAGKGDFDKRFKPIGISYSGLFKDILVEWAQRKDDIDNVVEQVGADLVEKLLGWIAGAPDIEKDFFWTHAFDVLTYWLLPTVREAVKVRVALKLFEGIQGLGENVHWSIIAHSMGTAVVHDTLHAWHNQPLAGGGTLGQIRAPRLIQMVANCSRVLQRGAAGHDPDAYDSDVRPGKSCEYYFSVQHPFDPVTIIRPFLPSNWPGGGEDAESRYSQVVFNPPDYVQQKDIHDLGHYLRHPDVVLPLLRCLAHKTYVGKENETKYRQAFKLHGDLTDLDLVAIRKSLEVLGIGLPDKWLGFLIAWQRLRELLGTAENEDANNE